MSNLDDIEDSLNMITYLHSYNESYRGSNFMIIQTEKQDWRVIMTTTVLSHKLDTYKEAFTYGMGYLDGCFEHLSEWKDDE